MEQPELVRMLISFPTDVREWVKSRREDRTMTAVIIRAVRAQMAQQSERREQVR
jgi:hypothetical protein